MDEQMKQPLLVGVIAFNIMFMVYQFFLNWGQDFSYPKLGLALVLGLVVGGGAFAALYFMARD